MIIWPTVVDALIATLAGVRAIVLRAIWRRRGVALRREFDELVGYRQIELDAFVRSDAPSDAKRVKTRAWTDLMDDHLKRVGVWVMDYPRRSRCAATRQETRR